MYSADAENPWILAASRAARLVPGWLMVVVAGVWAAAVIFLARAVGGTLSAVVSGFSVPWLYDAATAIVDAAVFGPLVLGAAIGGIVEGRSIWRAGARPLAALAGGLAVGAGGLALSLLIAFVAGAVVRGHTPAPGLALLGPVVVDAGLVLLAASAEEIYFRGWVQPVLGARWGPWVGLTVAAMMFCALHLAGGVRGPLAVFNIFLAGMFFGLLALRTGGLIASCAAHFAWNWSESGLFGSDPNPGAGPFGAVFDLDLTGSPLWSGGPDTMNGSLAVTLVMGCLIVGLAILGPNRSAAGARGRSDPAP